MLAWLSVMKHFRLNCMGLQKITQDNLFVLSGNLGLSLNLSMVFRFSISIKHCCILSVTELDKGNQDRNYKSF